MVLRKKKIRRKKREVEEINKETGETEKVVKQKHYFRKDAENAIIEHKYITGDLKKFQNLKVIRTLDLTIERYARQYSRENGVSSEDALKTLPENHVEFLSLKDCDDEIYKLRKQQEKIYVDKIQPAFDKLVENLIFIYGFLALHDHYEDLKADCVSFLYQAIPKYHESKGPAFAYFNIIAKNFLIIKSKSRSNKIKRNVSLDDPDMAGTKEMETVIEFYTIPSPDDLVEKNQFIFEIFDLIEAIKKKVKNDSENKCLYAIEDIFKRMGDLELLNKRAVFQYIRDHSGLTAKQLTTTMSVIKKYYKDSKRDLI